MYFWEGPGIESQFVRLLSVCGEQMPASENNQRIEYGKSKTKTILMAKAEKGLLKTYLVTTETAGAYCIGSADSVCVSTYKRGREVV